MADFYTLPRWACKQAKELMDGGILSYEQFFSRPRDPARLPDGLLQVLEAVEQCRRETPGAEALKTWVATTAITVDWINRRYSVNEMEYLVGNTRIGTHSLLQDLPYEYIEGCVRAAARAA